MIVMVQDVLLSSKLSGVTNPDEISRITWEHAEDMTRPPPKPTGADPMLRANKPTGKASKGNLVFVTHGIRQLQKRVHNFPAEYVRKCTIHKKT